MNKNAIVFIILLLLIAFSAVQAYQLTSLKAKIDAGAVKVGSSPVITSASGSSSSGGVNELPQMVGGC